MSTAHWNFHSFAQHVRWCNTLDFLIKSMLLFRNTSVHCDLSIHGSKIFWVILKETWLWSVESYNPVYQNRKLTCFFSYKNVFKPLYLSPKNYIEKWHYALKLLMNDRGARWRMHFICSNRKTVTQQFVVQYNWESSQSNLHALLDWFLKPILRKQVSVRSGHNILATQCRNKFYKVFIFKTW